jgi:hypothetical protein
MNPNLEQGLPNSNPDPQNLTLGDHIEYQQQVEAGNMSATLGQQEEDASTQASPAQDTMQQAVDDGSITEQARQDMSTAMQEGRMSENDSRADGINSVQDVWNEGVSVVQGGLRDAASSIVTAPERAQDMFNGQMEAAGDDYKPEFDPLQGAYNPYTKTWWGKMLRGGVHFGATVVGTALAIKAAAVAGLPGAGIAAVATGTKLGGATKAAQLAQGVAKGLAAKGRLAGMASTGRATKIGLKATTTGAFVGRGAVQGIIGDTFDETAMQDNFTGAIVKQYPQFDNFLATKDADHPSLKLFKNVVENMGIGIVFDTTLMALSKGLKGGADAVMAQVARRTESVRKQTDEMGMIQVESPEFGGYKNKPIADPQQGNPTSGPRDINDAVNQRRRVAQEGNDFSVTSMDELTTPAALNRMEPPSGMSGDDIKKMWKGIFGDEYFDNFVTDLRAQGQDEQQVFAEASKNLRNFFDPNGDLIDMEDADFQELLTAGVQQGIDADKTVMLSPAKLVAVDLVNASNTAVLKSAVLAAREAGEVLDISDIDGPMKTITDRLAFGIAEAKTARWLWSEQGRRIRTIEGADASSDAFQAKLKKDLNAQRKQMVNDAKTSVQAMVNLMERAPDRNTMDAMLEAFAMVPDARGLEDIHNYFDVKLKGGELDGKKVTGQAIRNMQGVTINSLLSGPKTPLKAMMGTSTAIATRPMAQAIGATFQGDRASAREAMAAYAALRQGLPDAWKIFKSKMNSLWKNEVQTDVKGYKVGSDDKVWEMIEADRSFRKANGEEYSVGNEIAFRMTQMGRALNRNNLFTYGSKLLQSTDTALAYVMAKMHTRQRAFRRALDESPSNQVNKELMRKYENEMWASIRDESGNIKWDDDASLKFMKEEVTLTRDLKGLAGGLDKAFKAVPWAQPFFLFARTGVNGLELGFKHTPLLNRLVADESKILNATPQMADAGKLVDVGITNARELRAAKQMSMGRQAMGAAVISGAAMMYLDGRITGNGPVNRQQRKLWTDLGWKPRSIKVMGKWVSYDSLEPFNTILAYVADSGDFMNEMGEETAEKNLLSASLVVAQGLTQKSYLAGMQQFVDLANAQDYQIEKMLANLGNNQLPLSSLRNELGKLFTPYMKELNSGLWDQLQNRNQLSEAMAGDNALAVKYDVLNGKPINDWNFMERMFNMVSPIALNNTYTPGREFLFESGYDYRLTAYKNFDRLDLKDHADVRSMYQKAIGEQNLDDQLDKLSQRPAVIRSMQQMEKDKANGKFNIDPGTYDHIGLIRDVFNRAQKRAWAKVRKDPKVQQLLQANTAQNAADYSRSRAMYDAAERRQREADELLNMPIK